MERKQHFLQLKDVVGHTNGNGNGIATNGRQVPVFGLSPIELSSIIDSKPARRSGELLQRAVDVGIFNPKVRVTNEAIIHTKNGLAFTKIVLPNGTSYFTHARVLSEKKGVSNTEKVKDVDALKVISGPCLFSAPAVEAKDERGYIHHITDPLSLNSLTRKITSISVDTRIQPYEIDAVLRLSQVISGLNQDKQITIVLNVPRIEYWFYALDLYQRGQIDTQQLTDWFGQINTRAQGLEHLIERRIPNSFTVNRINPLKSTDTAILDHLRSKRKNLFENIVDILANSDPVWNDAIGKTTPKTFTELGFLSYPVAHLLTARSGKHLTVVVENPEETKIMDKTEQLMGGILGDSVILGLYPHSNILLKQDSEFGRGKRLLYYYRPEQTLGEKREIFQANRPNNQT